MKAAPVKLLLVKHPVYQAISELNRAFEQVIIGLEGLSAFQFFRRDCLKASQVMVEEIRALANHELLEIVGQRAAIALIRFSLRAAFAFEGSTLTVSANSNSSWTRLRP